MTSLPRSAGALTRPVVRPPNRPSRQLGRPPRPVLLVLVYGVFLVIVGVTATAQAVLASVHFSTSALNHARRHRHQVVRGFVNEPPAPADLTAPAPRPASAWPRSRPASQSFVTPGASSGPRSGVPTAPSSPSDAPVAGSRVPDSADGATALAGTGRGRRRGRGRAEPGGRRRPGHRDGAPRVPPADRRTATSSASSGSGATPRRSSPALDDVRRDVVLVTLTAPPSSPRSCCS